MSFIHNSVNHFKLITKEPSNERNNEIIIKIENFLWNLVNHIYDFFHIPCININFFCKMKVLNLIFVMAISILVDCKYFILRTFCNNYCFDIKI